MSDAPAQTHEPGAAEAAPTTGDPQAEARAQALEQIRTLADAVKREVGRVFIGSDQIIEALLIALVAGGHVLLEGVPGVAKTTLVRAFARTLSVSFSRVQFTPDLLPSDITGVYIPNLQTQEFILRRGPIFASVVLGDEINRAPAKTQSAFLEAMQERQVTIEGETHQLP
ncbi:MAG: AAA domain-containing protein, partial [Proteobacteria bacterium]|nr:AAA domain-containing protein [Pseudomonadota bacterium]